MLYPNLHSFSGGEFLILAAAFVAPFGNFFQQRARKKVSSESIMFIRSLITTLIVLLIIFTFNIPLSFQNLKASLMFLLINGVLLFGVTKSLWIEGIHRISVTKANALTSTSPLITLFFAWLLLHNSPTIWQLLAFIPMFVGVILLSKENKTEETINP